MIPSPSSAFTTLFFCGIVGMIAYVLMTGQIRDEINIACAGEPMVCASWGNWEHNCTIVALQETPHNVVFEETRPLSSSVCVRRWSQNGTFIADAVRDGRLRLASTAPCWSVRKIACDSSDISLLRFLPHDEMCAMLRARDLTMMLVSSIIAFAIGLVGVIATCD